MDKTLSCICIHAGMRWMSQFDIAAFSSTIARIKSCRFRINVRSISFESCTAWCLIEWLCGWPPRAFHKISFLFNLLTLYKLHMSSTGSSSTEVTFSINQALRFPGNIAIQRHCLITRIFGCYCLLSFLVSTHHVHVVLSSTGVLKLITINI